MYESDESNVALWTLDNKRFDHIQTFVIDGYKDYPIVFRAQLSQTKSYKFWITHGGQDEKLDEPIHIRENIVLKNFINDQ